MIRRMGFPLLILWCCTLLSLAHAISSKVRKARDDVALDASTPAKETANEDDDVQELEDELELQKVIDEVLTEAAQKAVAVRDKWVHEAELRTSGLSHIRDEERVEYLAKIRKKADAMVQVFNNVKSKVSASSYGNLSSVEVADLLRKTEPETKKLMVGAAQELGEQFKDVTSACVEVVQSEISDLVQKASKSLDQLIAKAATKLEEKTRQLRDAVDKVGSCNENFGAAITVGKGIV